MLCAKVHQIEDINNLYTYLSWTVAKINQTYRELFIPHFTGFDLI